MLINHNFEEPFNKIPKEEELSFISQTYVNGKLTPKFWKYAKKFLNIDSNEFKKIYKEIKKNDQNGNKQNLIKEYEIYNNIKIENQPILNNNINGVNQNIIEEKNSNERNNTTNLDQINLDYINLEDLKKKSEQMQNQLNEKKIVISQQREEKIKLEHKIEKLEEMLSSLLSLDK